MNSIIPIPNIAGASIDTAPILLLTDGEPLTPSGAELFKGLPYEEWSRDYPHNSRGHIEVFSRVLLVRSSCGLTLIDAGGEHPSIAERRSDLLELLTMLRIGTVDIDRIIITHAHYDHVGYLVTPAGDGFLPTFPNAEVYISKTELENLQESDAASFERYFAPIKMKSLLKIVSGDRQISHHFKMFETPGHTLGHMSVLVELGGQRLIWCGDALPTCKHLEHRECTESWAVNSVAAKKSVDKLVEIAKTKCADLIIGHDPYNFLVSHQIL